MNMNVEDLLGCDTLVATGSATADGSVIFAKNSDRHAEECQHLRIYPARGWEAGAEVRCQYLTIPQARYTYRVLGGQPFWLWGFEHGVNEHGVAIGNEAIWTKAPRQAVGLLGMDLIRLGLERGASAREALEMMTTLLETYGQGGSPRHNDPTASSYDNSFILADPREAWILETGGRDWVARRVDGVASISNAPTIGVEFDAASATLRDRPGLDFARDLGDYAAHPQTGGRVRCARSRSLLAGRAGRIGVENMMAFLRDHAGDPHWKPGMPSEPTICVHSGPGRGGQTAASMVAHLQEDGVTAWCSLVTPCISVFLPVFLDAEVPAALARGDATFSAASPWWRIKRLGEHAAQDWETWFPRIRSRWEEWERALLRDAPRYQRASSQEKSRRLSDQVARLTRELDELERETGLTAAPAFAGSAERAAG
jgi:dipeptidase